MPRERSETGNLYVEKVRHLSGSNATVPGDEKSRLVTADQVGCQSPVVGDESRLNHGDTGRGLQSISTHITVSFNGRTTGSEPVNHGSSP
jgi:hypothetical protein